MFWRMGLGLLIACLIGSPVAHADDPGVSILQGASNSLVVVRVSYLDPGGVQQHETGTGFIISSGGYLLTNSHVVAIPSGSASVQITGSVGSIFSAQYPLTIVDRNTDADLALLRLPTTSAGWRALPLVRSAGQAGSQIFALGFPLGSDLDIKPGLLSNLNAQVAGDLRPWWQVSLALNPGNSGGPILDTHGRAIAVAVARNPDGQSISYVIPLATASALIGEGLGEFVSEGQLLLAAATENDVASVRQYLTHETFAALGPEQQNALMIAADKCRLDVARYIISRAADLHLDLNATNHYGDTALAIALGTDSDVRALGVRQPRCPSLVPYLTAAGAH